MTAKELVDIYLSFFEKRGHKRIENSSLVPQDDPTTLFTSSGMQSIIKYLLGEPHPQGRRLVNVQNCFRTVDIDEIGDNRHTTFFRMLGNWSLGDYFKSEQIPWFWEFLVNELRLDPKRLYVSVFEGYKNIKKDEESALIWSELFEKAGINPAGRIFYCGVNDNWWSRSGTPDEMPENEPGGPDTEVYFDFRPDEGGLNGSLDANIQSGRLLEIGNSVFMTYKKVGREFVEMAQKNVDYGGGLERQLAAVENKEDIFQTSLLKPIIQTVEQVSGKKYSDHAKPMRVITNHFVSAAFIIAAGVLPSNKMQGSVLRRLIRIAIDNLEALGAHNPEAILEKVVEQYKDTDSELVEHFENIKNTFAEEHQGYQKAQQGALKFLETKGYRAQRGDELKGTVEIPASVAFMGAASYGLSPTQLKSLGYTFDDQEYANLIKEHQQKSRGGKK